MHPAPNLLSRRYSRSGLKSFVEPPYADPHVRWCGEGGQRWLPLPDFVRILRCDVFVRRDYPEDGTSD